MNKMAFFGAALTLGVAALVACSSEATNPGAGGTDEEEETDAADFKRDGSAYDSAPSPESGLGEDPVPARPRLHGA